MEKPETAPQPGGQVMFIIGYVPWTYVKRMAHNLCGLLPKNPQPGLFRKTSDKSQLRVHLQNTDLKTVKVIGNKENLRNRHSLWLNGRNPRQTKDVRKKLRKPELRIQFSSVQSLSRVRLFVTP